VQQESSSSDHDNDHVEEVESDADATADANAGADTGADPAEYGLLSPSSSSSSSASSTQPVHTLSNVLVLLQREEQHISAALRSNRQLTRTVLKLINQRADEQHSARNQQRVKRYRGVRLRTDQSQQ